MQAANEIQERAFSIFIRGSTKAGRNQMSGEIEAAPKPRAVAVDNAMSPRKSELPKL